jgi:FHA domain
MPTCPAGHDSASSDFCDVCGMRMGGPTSSPAATLEAAGMGTQATTGQPQPEASQRTTRTGWRTTPCPRCGALSSGRFCESCGLDFDTGKAPQSAPTAEAAAGDSTVQPSIGAAPADTPAREPGSAPVATPVSEFGSAQASGPAPGSQAVWTGVVASDRAYYETVITTGGPDGASIQFPAYCPERRFQLTGPEMRIGRHSVSRGLVPEIDLTGPPTDPGVSRLHAVLIAQYDGSWAILDSGSENGTLVNGSEVTTGVPVSLHDGDQIHVGAWTVITVHAG